MREKNLTDSFEVQADLSPAPSFDTESLGAEPSFEDTPAQAPEEAVTAQPNGFVLMGLAPELVQAVTDLGYTQPTPVQIKAIPLALKKAKPGTAEFRSAVRDTLETMGRTVFSHGVMNWTPTDHWGYTLETGVMTKVVDGKFKVE